jgi:Lar family restriction alleviation protein
MSIRRSEPLKELKECPFCGSKAVMNDLGNNRYHIHCYSCPAQFGQVWSNDESKEFLIEGWNKRI